MACEHFQGLVPQQRLKKPNKNFTLSFLPKQTQNISNLLTKLWKLKKLIVVMGYIYIYIYFERLNTVKIMCSPSVKRYIIVRLRLVDHRSLDCRTTLSFYCKHTIMIHRRCVPLQLWNKPVAFKFYARLIVISIRL